MSLLIEPMIYFNKNDNEVWKPLIFENVEVGRYLISNYGRVYDLKLDKYVNPRMHNHGYLSIQLSGMGLLLHRVVAENFVGERRIDQTHVNHLDGNKTNPRDINLEWCTMYENNRHAVETGLMPHGEDSYNARITEEQAIIICKMLSEARSNSEILSVIGLENNITNRAIITNILTRKSWKHVSKDYEFPKINRSAQFINDEIAEKICKLIVKGLSNKEICEKIFGIHIDKWSQENRSEQLAISNIRRGINYKHISSKYF